MSTFHSTFSLYEGVRINNITSILITRKGTCVCVCIMNKGENIMSGYNVWVIRFWILLLRTVGGVLFFHKRSGPVGQSGPGTAASLTWTRRSVSLWLHTASPLLWLTRASREITTATHSIIQCGAASRHHRIHCRTLKLISYGTKRESRRLKQHVLSSHSYRSSRA